MAWGGGGSSNVPNNGGKGGKSQYGDNGGNGAELGRWRRVSRWRGWNSKRCWTG
ncbi:hypothetical protein [Bartonella pachyuromydis]|uniref:hypothetical protein n=1 Tax=Bartonella pachyuromydis TaxID=931097 RepID=UPI0031EC6D53